MGFKRRARLLDSLIDRIKYLEAGRDRDFERVGRLRRFAHEMHTMGMERLGYLEGRVAELEEAAENVVAVDMGGPDCTSGAICEYRDGAYVTLATYTRKGDTTNVVVHEGMTSEELAKALGVTTGTIRIRWAP